MRKVSVLVLNHNGAALLPDCLSSLLAQDYPNLEVIVVDNASADDSEQVAQRYGVRFVQMPGNLGFAPAYNAAIEHASGEFLFFVNNDMRFEPDCVKRLANKLELDDSLFAVDPLQYNWEGTEVVHAGTTLHPGPLFSLFFPGVMVDFSGSMQSNLEIPWGCAGSLMVRRDRFEALRGFDQTFFIDYEDVDLCWRAWQRGWRTVFVPEARLYHKVSVSFQPRGDQKVSPWELRRMQSKVQNHLRFAFKSLDGFQVAIISMQTVGRIPLNLMRGRWHSARAITAGTWFALRHLPDSLQERRTVRQNCAISNRELLGKFVH